LSNKENSIHEFSVQTIVKYFADCPRQGPGGPEMTKKALSFVKGLNKDSVIADLGCGAGTQTKVLAENTPAGQIIASDLAELFIERVNSLINQLGMNDRVKGVVESMDSLSFEKEQLDLLWCEGAIYNIGFEKGLEYWKQFIKPGGYVAVSEAVWLTDERPEEIQNFWNNSYPDIDTIPNRLAQVQKAGYVPVASFVYPEECWIDNYHAPQEPVMEQFLKDNAGNKEAEGFIGFQKLEAEMYRKYKDYYGYVFFIGKKL
jgi:SAM-dependent methyltransferase